MSTRAISGMSRSYSGSMKPRFTESDNELSFDQGFTKAMIDDAQTMARAHIAESAKTIERFHKNSGIGGN